MVSLGIAAILAIYVLTMGFGFWFCVIADPATSPTALFVSHTLPTEFMKKAGKVVGPKGVKFIEAFMERLLAVIYLTVVLGCFGLLLIHGYPKARASTHVADFYLNIGYVVFFVALYTWRKTMTTSPGIINKDTIQFYDHYPYDDLLYVDGRKDKSKGIPRIPRSKFDRLKYHQHVARFDHYCGWVASTIGEENYRLFLFFVFTQFAMCVYATCILAMFFNGEIVDNDLLNVVFFDKSSGIEYQASKWIVFQYLFHRHMYESGVVAITGVMSIALFFFLGYHFYITSRGMTTNEHYKWGEVRKWHKNQVRKFEEYRKTHPISGDESKSQIGIANKPTIPDVDVTCTGGQGNNPQAADNSLPDDYMEDPGPMPINIYNRGFIENWKEVLFPISLRRKAAAARGATDKSKYT